ALALLPDQVDVLLVHLAGAVREVQAEHVHAGLDQPGDHLLATGGRAQGRHDLGAPLDHRRNAPRPRNRAVGPSSSSMSSSRLYFAVRSLRLAEPVLIWPAFTATARSEMK